MAFDHVVVLGGSVAGLLAAAALSDSFESVTIVEPDELPLDGPDARRPRRGVPHGFQIHHMLALGSERIDELLPGFDDELVREGGERRDPVGDFGQFIDDKWVLRVRSGLQITCFQRPLLEWVIRRRVLARDNVVIRRGVARGLLASSDGRRVVGVTVGDAPADHILGDLVVDATGRGSSAAKWLEQLGYGAPEESQLRVWMGYSTFLIRFPHGALPEGVHGISSTNGTAGAAIRPCGEGLHIVMAGGVMRDYPPRDLHGLTHYFEGLATPLLAEFLLRGEVVSDVETFRMVGDHRRYWERLEPRPEGFVLVGDAVSYFNPMYGQGMTMAALGASALRDVAAAAHDQIDGLASAAQSAIARWVDIAFNNAVRLDSAYSGCEFVNLQPPPRNPELERALTGLATEDPEIAIEMRRAILNMDNSFIQRQSIQQKIADWIDSGRTVSPGATDPRSLPELVVDKVDKEA
jgi:2-polyprenyl-6-methoxyphenol hydroxylase-like FAD-dependent oxidoreductase